MALHGCGTVGSGVVWLLTEDRDYLADRTGLRFEVRHLLAGQGGRAPAAVAAPAGRL